MRRIVDLPQRLGPISDIIPPAGTENDTRSTASSGTPSAVRNRFDTSRIRSDAASSDPGDGLPTGCGSAVSRPASSTFIFQPREAYHEEEHQDALPRLPA